jgi:plastocyanin
MKKITGLLVLALAIAGCGSSSSKSSSSTSSSSASDSSSASTASGGSATDVDMYDNYFKAKTITGKAGSTVKVTLKNEGQREHNFKIDSQSAADADLAPGKSATVSVKIPASGSVQFYCEYHKGLGMVGTVKPS